jgi:universal stress protein A
MVAKRILFCTDFSQNSLPARRKAIEYAAAFGAELLILHVVGARHFGYPGFQDALGTEMAKLSQKIDERVQEEMSHESRKCLRFVKQVSTFLRSGEPAPEIVRFARKHRVDLIVMGTHGWGGVKRLFLGSTATNVARMATCPVMAVRAPAQA